MAAPARRPGDSAALRTGAPWPTPSETPVEPAVTVTPDPMERGRRVGALPGQGEASWRGGARCGRGPRALPGRAPHCRPYVTSVGRPGVGAAPSPSESADALGAPAELSLPTPHRQAGGAGSHRATEGEGATHGAPQPEEPPEPASGPTQPLGGTLLELALCGVLGLGLQDWGLPAAFLGEPQLPLPGAPPPRAALAGPIRRWLWDCPPVGEPAGLCLCRAEQSHQEVHRPPSRRFPPPAGSPAAW